MTSSTSNPQVEEIQRQLRSSYGELQRFIDGPLSSIDPHRLYRSPGGEEWTVMENLAHIVEFLPFWGDEVAKLVAQPGCNFGRTMDHEGRLNAISDHGGDSLEQVKALLPGSYAHLEHILGSLQDRDLELIGHHTKFGDRKLGWFIHEFITQHLANHVEQLKACL